MWATSVARFERGFVAALQALDAAVGTGQKFLLDRHLARALAESLGVLTRVMLFGGVEEPIFLQNL